MSAVTPASTSVTESEAAASARGASAAVGPRGRQIVAEAVVGLGLVIGSLAPGRPRRGLVVAALPLIVATVLGSLAVTQPGWNAPWAGPDGGSARDAGDVTAAPVLAFAVAGALGILAVLPALSGRSGARSSRTTPAPHPEGAGSPRA